MTGLEGERLTLVAVGSVVAIVGELSRVPRPTEIHLRQYDCILRALSHRTTAILPARYGTRVRDIDELRLILRSRQDSLRRRLQAVRNRVQMTVRVLDAEPAIPGSRQTRATTGAEYLRTRARDAARAREIPQFTPLRHAVRRWVRAEEVDRRGAIATVYHLVPRGSAGAYRRALLRAARETGVRAVISGPWPPYAFADPIEIS